MPERKNIANIDGRWVKKAKGWESVLTNDMLEQFYQINGQTLKDMGYNR